MLSLAAVLGALQPAVILLASGASAAPSPTPSTSKSGDACDLIVGLAKDYCDGTKANPTAPTPSNDPLDPLSSLAKGFADAAAWIVGKLSEAVKNTANVDFTNASFLRQYAVVFAASTILTLVLWLLAVAKRAVRGVPLTTAVSEAIGFLWLTVIASAFTPLILYTRRLGDRRRDRGDLHIHRRAERRLLRVVRRGAQEGHRHRRRADHADRGLPGVDPRRRRALAGARHPGRPALRRAPCSAPSCTRGLSTRTCGDTSAAGPAS